MSDAHALEQLDVLLDLESEQRGPWLERLATQDPALHSRLVRLWNAAVTSESSRKLRAHVPAGMRERAGGPTLSSGQIVAGYRLLEEIGRGGMAVVWRAERADGIVRRDVALKLPLFLSNSPSELARFASERDALAALSHPNIAQLYDAGVTAEGQPFIVLELVHGEPLTSYCDARALALTARLALFLEVLAAVEHAHRHLIVHRDLKPSNILVNADGHVKLLDFGIAKLLDNAALASGVALTEHGNAVLTPRYAAPEQVTGQPISTLTDVFVLGVLLHQILTGKLPYAHQVGDAPSLAQMVGALTRGESSRPSCAQITEEAAKARGMPTATRLIAALRGDLDTVVKKALSPVPEHRYGSAGDMAQDIRRFLSHMPISARPASRWYAVRLLLRRHRSVSATAGLGLLAALTLGVVAWQNHQQSRMYEARGIAVRDFMRDFVNDAEPGEGQPDAPVTFLDMIGASVRRARADYVAQPILQGELLGELGRMYTVLGKHELSVPVLEEALERLERHAPPSDPALNKTRTYLAAELLRRNDMVRARDLAARALESCTRDDQDCAKARANAQTLLSRLEFVAGHTELALELKRRAVQATIRAYGRVHPQTVISMHGLATAARNNGRLIEAATVIADASQLAAKVSLKKADRTAVLRTAAVLDIDLGRYQQARDRISSLLDSTHEREERALLFRLYANASLGLGEPRVAADALQEALKLTDTSRLEIESLFARQSRSQALAMLERHEEAIGEIDAALAGLRMVGYAEDSYEMLRARRIRAEVLLRGGHVEDADLELDAILGQHATMREKHPLERGLAMDLRGCAQRELGRPPAARQLHEQATRYLREQLPLDHPFMRRNTLYQSAAAGNAAALGQQARLYQAGLPPGSLWLQLIEVNEGHKSCRDLGRQICTFIL